MSPDNDSARRRFWIESMDRADRLTEQMLAWPCDECGEPFGSIRDAVGAAGVEVLYADSRIGGTLDRIFHIRAGLLPHLVSAARAMNDRGWILKIEDAYRTREMQTALCRSPAIFDRVLRSCAWECHNRKPALELVFKRARVLIAQYPKSGTHTQGAAVDISVLRRDDGAEVWRGKPYLEMSEYTPMDSPFVTAGEKTARETITGIMAMHGFVHYPGEFWHYNQGDAMARILTGSRKPGRYGPVHWDPQTNETRPYDDPFERLVSEPELETLLAEALARI